MLAETKGFEPLVDITAHDGLANRCLRPLSHVSIVLLYAIYQLMSIAIFSDNIKTYHDPVFGSFIYSSPMPHISWK